MKKIQSDSRTTSSPTRILLTGFRPYDGMTINPTEQLMRRAPAILTGISGITLRALVLETDYRRSEQQFLAALDDFRPDVALSFGLSRRIDEIKLERVGINVDDSPIPDNSGRLRRGQKIAEAGPVGYWATIPIEAILQALQDAGIPAGVSNHAGAYICNHLLYFGLHVIAARGLPTRMGFVHTPPLPEMVQDGSGRSGMRMEMLVEAVRIIVAAIAGRL